MLIKVKRDNGNVVLNIDTDLANSCDGNHVASFPFSFSVGQPYSADLLARYIEKRIHEAISSTRRVYYDKGWKDARAKSQKDDWFSGVL